MRELRLISAVTIGLGIYYADLAKDFLLTWTYETRVLGQRGHLFSPQSLEKHPYPLVILAILASSLVLTELLNWATFIQGRVTRFVMNSHFESLKKAENV